MARLRWALLLVLCACSPVEPSQASDPISEVSPSGQLAFDADLWQATRETLDFMPIDSADPLAGGIETDWGQPQGGTGCDRYRVAVRLNYRRAYADAATVTMDHQVLQNGEWVETPADIAATYALATAIGNRAGELRLAANSSK